MNLLATQGVSSSDLGSMTDQELDELLIEVEGSEAGAPSAAPTMDSPSGRRLRGSQKKH